MIPRRVEDQTKIPNRMPYLTICDVLLPSDPLSLIAAMATAIRQPRRSDSFSAGKAMISRMSDSSARK